MPAIVVKLDAKYETRLIQNIRKVSVMALTVRNRQYLNSKLVRNPKIRPIDSDTTPSIKN